MVIRERIHRSSHKLERVGTVCSTEIANSSRLVLGGCCLVMRAHLPVIFVYKSTLVLGFWDSSCLGWRGQTDRLSSAKGQRAIVEAGAYLQGNRTIPCEYLPNELQPATRLKLGSGPCVPCCIRNGVGYYKQNIRRAFDLDHRPICSSRGGGPGPKYCIHHP